MTPTRVEASSSATNTATKSSDSSPANTEATNNREAVALLRRLTYGPRLGDVGWLNTLGLHGWLDAQLAPDDSADVDLKRRLDALKLPIKYAAGPNTPAPNGVVQSWPAVDEQGQLMYVQAPIETAWKVVDRSVAMDNAARRRPRDEVIAATLLRAVYSRWQLREVIVNFWHDHFNVDAYSSDQITAALPSYDRDVIRAHAFGNFREFLEAVATSTAMQFYLSNRSSRAGAANENYARELFELHTLGSAAYLNDRYDRWRDVPGALNGKPSGYIDQDVYEAARAFTGWTVADGTRVDNRTQLPNTGRFIYVEGWHDGNQKRVLAQDFDPFQAALADGRKVLDLVAAHPATANFVARKLCVRLIGASVSEPTVKMAATVFRDNRQRSDQIARTIKAIVLAAEFDKRAPKIQRPLNAMASFVRATGMDFTPSEGLVNQLSGCGQRLFGWPTPNGFPDDDSYLISASALRQRWGLMLGLANNNWKNGTIPIALLEQLNVLTPEAASGYWLNNLIGASSAQQQHAIAASTGWALDKPVAPPGGERQKRLARLAGLCALVPEALLA
ncbi:MAG: hypothetical protein JWM78_2095 [Verrucomicrobiaceae bacterium]|nr:hypothetical protein [Verrucomicrobiaceae bacterium]